MGNQKGLAGLRDWAVKKAVDTVFPRIKCPNCGFPLRMAAFVYWRKSGTIAPIFVGKYVRMALMPTGMYDRLFEGIEEWLGISIEHVIFEAERNISKSLFESFIKALPVLDYFRRISLAKRLVVEAFNKVAIMSGMSDSKTLEYRPGEYGLARLRNPYNLQLMAANVIGAFEFLEGFPFDYALIDEGINSYLVEVHATDKKPAISTRLISDNPLTAPGNLEYDRCTLCYAPWKVSRRLRWLDDEGKIIDTQSGSRVFGMEALLLKTVFRELATELGDEVYEKVVQAQRDWTIEHVELLGKSPGNAGLKGKDFQEAFQEYLDDLPIFGYGCSDMLTMKDRQVQVRMRNPFEENFIAGTLQGLYQTFSSEECRISWEVVQEGLVDYTIDPI